MRATFEFDLLTGAQVASGRRVCVPIFVPQAIESPRFKISALETSPNSGSQALQTLSSKETWHISTAKNLTVAGDITSMVAASHIYCVSEVDGSVQTVTVCDVKNVPVGCAYMPLDNNPLSVEKIRLTTPKGFEMRGQGHLLIVNYNESGVIVNKQFLHLCQDNNPYNRVQNIIDVDVQFTITHQTEVYFIAPSDVSIPTNTKICTINFVIK